MESVLDKAWFRNAVDGKVKFLEIEELRVIAGLVVGVIEIREAAEAGLAKLAVWQLVVAKEIADAIRDNTAVQKEILEHARGISGESCDLMTTISGFTEELKAVSDGLASQKEVVGGLIKVVAQLGDEFGRHTHDVHGDQVGTSQARIVAEEKSPESVGQGGPV